MNRSPEGALRARAPRFALRASRFAKMVRNLRIFCCVSVILLFTPQDLLNIIFTLYPTTLLYHCPYKSGLVCPIQAKNDQNKNGPKSTHFLLRKRDLIVNTTGFAQYYLYIISNNFALPLPLQKWLSLPDTGQKTTKNGQNGIKSRIKKCPKCDIIRVFAL